MINQYEGVMQRSQLSKVPFQKQLVGSLALIVLGFNFTKRFYTFPHHHKDETKPMTLLNGELHPFEHQPEVNNLYSEFIREQIKLQDLIKSTFSLHDIFVKNFDKLLREC